ncbi:MAG TPA: hypothetical protein VH560_09705, partial [Polyangia bacterium]|nr:hypothetical protein [Polyangia bacterium]
MSKLVNATIAATLWGALVGCDPSSGTPLKEPGGPDIDSSADASVAEVAAMPDAATNPAAQFLGVWSYMSGVGSLQCVAATPAPFSVTGFVKFLSGGSDDQVIVVDDQGCQVPGTVSGNVVVAVVGSTCPDEGLTYTSLV